MLLLSLQAATSTVVTDELMEFGNEEKVQADESPADKRDIAELNKIVSELKTEKSNLELHVQKVEKELVNKSQKLKDFESEMNQMVGQVDELSKRFKNTDNELTKVTAQRDQCTTELAEKDHKLKQLTKELECQSHNAEAARRTMEEKMKEKEKHFR